MSFATVRRVASGAQLIRPVVIPSTTRTSVGAALMPRSSDPSIRAESGSTLKSAGFPAVTVRAALDAFRPAATDTWSMTLDALSAHWRAAFRAAEESIRCAGYARFDPHELHERAHRLTQERGEVARLLDAVARDEHAHLRRSLTAPPATIRMLGLSTRRRAMSRSPSRRRPGRTRTREAAR